MAVPMAGQTAARPASSRAAACWYTTPSDAPSSSDGAKVPPTRPLATQTEVVSSLAHSRPTPGHGSSALPPAPPRLPLRTGSSVCAATLLPTTPSATAAAAAPESRIASRVEYPKKSTCGKTMETRPHSSPALAGRSQRGTRSVRKKERIAAVIRLKTSAVMPETVPSPT